MFTGGMNSITRDEAEKAVKRLGGKASSSVSKRTDYVVAGSDPGSKYKKAQELNITILTEQEFLNLIKEE